MRAAWADRPSVMVLFGLVVALLTWDPILLTPGAGLDASWITGLNMAAAAGLDHGTEIVYTYGPLGFLDEPLVIDGTLATTGAVYLLGMRAALAASLLYAARRSLPWPAAAAVALVVMAIMPGSLVPLALAALWCLVALQADPPRWIAPLILAGGGALAGIEILVKLNVGITIPALVVATALALPGRRARNLLALAGAFAVSFAIGWFAAGQGLGNLDDYARSSLETVTGYSDALQRDVAEVSWDWAAALALAAGTLAAAYFASAGMRTARRALLLVVVALLALALEKYSFVRHDAGHVGAFFGGLGAVLVALRWRGVGRFVLPVAIAATAAAYAAATSAWSDGPLRPGLAVDQLEALIDPGDRGDTRDEARQALQNVYGVDPEILDEIGNAPVDARPWETALVWAYDLNWRPLPVIQDYQAYTPWLDKLDAQALAADGGPQFILRHYGYGDSPVIGLEGRFEPFSSPLVTRTLLCRFRPAITAGLFQLLERGENRCGTARSLGEVSAEYGESIPVPVAKPGEAVIATIHGATASGIERIRALLYRAAVRRIRLDEGRAFLAPRTAADGLLLSAPQSAGYRAPWVLALNPREIAIESDGGFATSEPMLEIEFFAIPVGSSVSLD